MGKSTKVHTTDSGKKLKVQEGGEVVASSGDFAVILGAVITEKSSLIGGAGNKVVMQVNPKATKTEIRQAVERIFKVKVASVHTVNLMGKPKRSRVAIGRRAKTRKAYVTLAKGQTIDLIEGL